MEGTSEREARQSRSSAGAILRRVFGTTKPGLRYRLWDGSEGSVGDPDGSFTLVIRDRDTFREVFGSTNTRVMAEAFIDNRIDVEGDLFAALRAANQLEDLEFGWLEKLGIFLEMRHV